MGFNPLNPHNHPIRKPTVLIPSLGWRELNQGAVKHHLPKVSWSQDLKSDNLSPLVTLLRHGASSFPVLNETTAQRLEFHFLLNFCSFRSITIVKEAKIPLSGSLP
jgi:hypothetical protein